MAFISMEWRVLIDVYSKSGLVQAAETIFNKKNCKGKSVPAVWNAMISGSSQNGLFQQSLIIFKQKLEENIMPNAVTLASILLACSQLGSTSLGRLFHGFATHNFLGKKQCLWGLLWPRCTRNQVTLLTQRKCLRDCLKEIRSLTLATMILGYAQHGMGEKALLLFHSMKKESNINPDAITFVAVLSACSYTGLINEGLELFNSMESEYMIKPSTEHYACVVDMLGRVGRVIEAYEFAQKLGREGNVFRLNCSKWRVQIGFWVITFFFPTYMQKRETGNM